MVIRVFATHLLDGKLLSVTLRNCAKPCFSGPTNGSAGPPPDEGDVTNPGTNLFVTGIHPRLSEDDVSRLFEKYGNVEECNIMRDPHTQESRGFGFIRMTVVTEANAARESLQGEVFEGRTLSIELARRGKPRGPTPGKYYGPPKRGTFSGPVMGSCSYITDDGPRRGGYGGRDDRRGGGYRDDYRGPGRGGDYGYGRPIHSRGGERGYGGRDDYDRRDDRRGGGYDRGYDRAPRDYQDDRYRDRR